MIRELWIKYFKDPSAHFDLAISGWLKSTKEVAVHGYRSHILFKNEAVSDSLVYLIFLTKITQHFLGRFWLFLCTVNTLMLQNNILKRTELRR